MMSALTMCGSTFINGQQTDFEQFRLYGTTLTPIFNDPRCGLVKELAIAF